MASILVIDDDVQIQHLIQLTLQAAGHDVRCAGNGVKGLEAHRQQPADVVVCDLFMPEKDGLETIRELRRVSPRLKVIAISGGWARYTQADYLADAKRFGAMSALRKPFRPAELTAEV